MRDGTSVAVVAVVHGDPPYLRTHADNRWSDHLLALPEY